MMLYIMEIKDAQSDQTLCLKGTGTNLLNSRLKNVSPKKGL